MGSSPSDSRRRDPNHRLPLAAVAAFATSWASPQIAHAETGDPTVGGGPLVGDTANAYPVVHPDVDCATVGLPQLTTEVLQVFWE